MTGAKITAVPDECYRCGYQLRGIADDQACPECGLLAERSRRVSDGLHDTRPKWLRALSRGTNVVLLGFVRWSLRISALMTFLAMVLHAVMFQMTGRVNRVLNVPIHRANQEMDIIAAVVFVAVPLPFLLFFRLRGLARRARSAHLAEHCLIVGVGASAAFLCVAVIISIFRNTRVGPYWLERLTAPIVMGVFLSVTGFLFILWAFYVFVRFTIAFYRASRQLNQKWRRDDRAEPAV